ncbi:phospholipid carrier-dependent glycosyltransferase [Streptomyces sp. NA04227]|uniref:ArnT family glycosyltransferase n=1 Tax=Streptomyces sp. NA04227 TaxID=2742136 RepID=UPI001590393E|nr:phospholipid carrier-dependent glycosyltransferase [Streptomyces sp. NA04227]QKW09737.1 phospholipid carrier-dependent glycosyltransferase [Streptomyces sp. NA04227]
MTVTEQPRTRVPAPVRRVRGLPTALLALALFALTAALRIVGLDRSADLFVDELIYRELGASAARGGFPRTDEGLFFLHPPGYFYVQAGWGELIGFSPDLATSIYEARLLSVLFGAGTAALLMLLVTRASGSRIAGVLTALLFALDPYVIRQNDRAMLDTLTMFWVVAGYLALLGLCRRPGPDRKYGRAVAVGLLFGMALLTKEHSALITLLPLLLALLLGWGPPRRLLATVAGASLVPYAAYLTVVYTTGHFEGFLWAKQNGVQRLIGVVQDTGFNAEGTPSLASRLAAELATFASTYGLLALGPIALVVLIRRKDPGLRMLALFELCAGFTLLFALTQGTLEEQALYLLVVPNLAALGVAGALLVRRVPAAPGRMKDERPARLLRRRFLLATTALVLGAATVFSSVSYVEGRTQRDDGFARLRAYMAENVPNGAAVTAGDGASAGGISSWALKDRYQVGDWLTPADREHSRVRYLVVPWKLLDQGYGRLDADSVRRLAKEGRLVFSVHERSYGTLALYELPLPGQANGKASPAGHLTGAGSGHDR